MNQKNKILLVLFGVVFLGAIGCRVFGYNPLLVIVIGGLVLFLFYVLWDMPSKHKTFSYKDQQRAMRAFDRSNQIDLGKPDWAKGKKK